MIAALYSEMRNKTRPFRWLFVFYAAARFVRLKAELTAYRRRDATIIAVTGSSGKTTATYLLSHILSAHGKTAGSFLRNNLRPIEETMTQMTKSHRYGVFECAIGKYDSIGPQASLLKPDVVSVTMAALEHKSDFQTVERIAEEKSKLVRALRPDGFFCCKRRQ